MSRQSRVQHWTSKNGRTTDRSLSQQQDVQSRLQCHPRRRPRFRHRLHCTNVQVASRVGLRQPEPFQQSGLRFKTRLLDDHACPSGKQCRYSDSAFVEYTPTVLATQGAVARTTAITTTALNSILTIDHGRPRFLVLGAGTTVANATLNKVGRTTGWSQGQVLATCFDTNVASSTVHLLCQYQLGGNAQVQGGDSGSPVFGIVDATKSTVRLL